MRRFISRWKGRYNYLVPPTTTPSSWLKKKQLERAHKSCREGGGQPAGDVVTVWERQATKKIESLLCYLWRRRSFAGGGSVRSLTETPIVLLFFHSLSPFSPSYFLLFFYLFLFFQPCQLTKLLWLRQLMTHHLVVCTFRV